MHNVKLILYLFFFLIQQKHMLTYIGGPLNIVLVIRGPWSQKLMIRMQLQETWKALAKLAFSGIKKFKCGDLQIHMMRKNMQTKLQCSM